MLLLGSLLAASIVGCSPEPLKVHAVAVDGAGTPVLLVRGCKDTIVSTVDVVEIGRRAETSDKPLMWMVSPPDPPPSTFELPGLSTPPGWDVVEKTLERFLEGVDYSSGVGFQGSPDSYSVRFSLADLRALPSDHVLTADPPRSKSRAVKRAEFEKRAKKEC